MSPSIVVSLVVFVAIVVNTTNVLEYLILKQRGPDDHGFDLKEIASFLLPSIFIEHSNSGHSHSLGIRTMANTVQRTAELTDIKDIWNLMREVAADVPFDLANEIAQQSVLSELLRCCTSGLSRIAVGPDKAVIGAVLVRRDDFEWGLRNSSAVHIIYAAVAPAARENGLLKELVTEVQEGKVPVFASIKTGNQFGLADKFKELGFALECTAESGWGELYKWQPPANGAAVS
jgi:hypothetical protein